MCDVTCGTLVTPLQLSQNVLRQFQVTGYAVLALSKIELLRCMPGLLTRSDWLKRSLAFPVHAWPANLRIWQEACEELPVQYRTRISSPLMRAFASHRMRAFASHRIACGEMRACASIRIACAKCAHMHAFSSHARKCAHRRAFASHARITTRKTRKWDCGNDANPSVLVPDPWNWVCSHQVHSQILGLRLKLKKRYLSIYTHLATSSNRHIW